MSLRAVRFQRRRSNLLFDAERIMMRPFEAFGEILKDLKDQFICLLRRNEPTIPFEEVIEKLKQDGKLIE